MSEASPSARQVALVAIGGSIGAVSRYGLAEAFPIAPATIPITTLSMNVLGAFALGLLLEYLLRRDHLDGWARPLIGIGVLGSFTTFSAFAVEVAELLREGEPLLATAYVAASLVGGITACVIGLTVGGWRRGPTPGEGES